MRADGASFRSCSLIASYDEDTSTLPICLHVENRDVCSTTGANPQDLYILNFGRGVQAQAPSQCRIFTRKRTSSTGSPFWTTRNEHFQPSPPSPSPRDPSPNRLYPSSLASHHLTALPSSTERPPSLPSTALTALLRTSSTTRRTASRKTHPNSLRAAADTILLPLRSGVVRAPAAGVAATLGLRGPWLVGWGVIHL